MSADPNASLLNDTAGVSDDSFFDLDIMVNSAINIKGKFSIFGNSLVQIDKVLDEFINGTDSIYIKTPIFGQHLNEIWHDLSLAQMGEFQQEFSGWSDLIKAAYVKNQTFTDEAEKAFSELLDATSAENAYNGGGVFSGVVSASGSGIARTTLDYVATRAIYGMTGAHNITDDEYISRYDSLNEGLQQVVSDKNAADAEHFFSSFSGYLGDNQDLFFRMLSNYNPEVERLVMQKVTDLGVNTNDPGDGVEGSAR